MSEVTSYAQGTPSWVDLATADEQGALAFYSALFGWSDNPMPMGPDSYYHMMELKGKTVGAIRELGPEELGNGVPPHWSTYIAVDNADEATERVTAAGGTVLMEPMEVFDAGRMAFVQDPTGAMVALWQARNHIGSTIVNEPGAVIWTELLSTDAARAVEFYSTVLQVVTSKMPGPMDYTIINVNERGVAGIMQITPETGQMPSCWVTYFCADSVDATAEQVTALGGSVMRPPQDIPNIGRFAVVQDPQGAAFCLFQTENPGS